MRWECSVDGFLYWRRPKRVSAVYCPAVQAYSYHDDQAQSVSSARDALIRDERRGRFRVRGAMWSMNFCRENEGEFPALFNRKV